MTSIQLKLVTTPARAGVPDVDEALYGIRRKIYPRAVIGVHARWRWTIMLATQAAFYGLPWLEWNARQAVLLDHAARKLYLFGLVLWPQDAIYLAVLAVIAVLSLFLFTAVAGRLWCGYTCPQTVYTEIFMWIERNIEGDRLARIRMDAAPMSLAKFARKSAKHAAWMLLALWTGLTFVGYFVPIRSLTHTAAMMQPGAWESFWIVLYGLATYGNAGWMRERVCKHVCAYARLQGVMFDRDTLIVGYDPGRGEPRGERSCQADPRAAGLGDCVDCGVCVQVCPTAIDIRDGLQYECIGCTACIDGCDAVMAKMGYPPGLIRYDTANGLDRRLPFRWKLRRVLRPRTITCAAALIAIVAGLTFSLVSRQPL